MRKAIVGVSVASVLLVVALYSRYSREPAPDDPMVPAKTVRPSEPRRLNANHWIVSRFDRDAYLKDLARITKQFTLKPTPGKDPDSVSDLSIFELAQESPMYAAGFRKDDRILKVNGTPVATMSRAVNLVHEIKGCNRLTVQVQRGDQVVDYQFDFE